MTLRLRADDASVRPRLSAAAIAAFVPAAAGPFRFPAPYDVDGVRLTDPSDGAIEPVGYAYWNNANNHAGQAEVLVALGRGDRPGLLVAVEKATGRVSKRELPLTGTGEGWRFSHVRPFALYVTEGPVLSRLDVRDFSRETVLDLRAHGRAGHYLWQTHSSADDRVHSATLRVDGTWEVLGALVYDEDRGTLLELPKRGDDFDECQVDRSGRFLLVKEGADVRIVDLESGASTWLLDRDGAPGHSDCGFGAVVGEDDRATEPGAFRFWALEPGGRATDGHVAYHMIGWEPMSRHVSWTAARADDPRAQRVLVSSASRDWDLPRANELVLATLDGSLACEVIAPTLVDLDAPGGGDDYRKLPKANVDPTGAYAVWTANCGGDRLDAFLVRLGESVVAPAPPPVILPPSGEHPMDVPTYSKALDGILSVGAAPTAGAGPVTLLAPDGSGNIVRVDPQGNVSYTDPGHVDPYSQFWISADGSKASIMPLRADGPLPGARWWHYGLMVVPTTGL